MSMVCSFVDVSKSSELLRSIKGQDLLSVLDLL